MPTSGTNRLILSTSDKSNLSKNLLNANEVAKGKDKKKKKK